MYNYVETYQCIILLIACPVQVLVLYSKNVIHGNITIEKLFVSIFLNMFG